MILVDSSVWIDFLKGRNAPHVRRLAAAMGNEEIVVGDLMLCEILQGLATDEDAVAVETMLRSFDIVQIVTDQTAVAAAAHFRTLRKRGITIRTTIDLLIGTWCIAHGIPLLHNDRDFQPMATYLGLVEAAV